jgi:hypothetical protein
MSANLSFRRLHEPLKEVDRRLWRWGDWSRDMGHTIGWAATSVAWRLAHIHETGQSFSSVTPEIHMPDDIEEVEKAVLKLPPDLSAIVHIQYFSGDPIELKARRAKLHRGVYSSRLENLRWTMKTLLGC